MADSQYAPGKRQQRHRRQTAASENNDWHPRRAESRHSVPYRTRQPEVQRSDRRKPKHPSHPARVSEDLLGARSMPPPVRMLGKPTTLKSRGRRPFEDAYDDDDDDEDDEENDDDSEKERLRGRLRSRSRSRAPSRPVSRPASVWDLKARTASRARSRVKSGPGSLDSPSIESITIATPSRSSFVHIHSAPSAPSIGAPTDSSSEDSDDDSDSTQDYGAKSRTLKQRMNGSPDSEPAGNRTSRSRSRHIPRGRTVPVIESDTEDSEDEVISHHPRVVVKRPVMSRQKPPQSRSPSRAPVRRRRSNRHSEEDIRFSPKRAPKKYYHSDVSYAGKPSFARPRATSASRMTSYSVGASSKQHLGKFFEASAQPPRFDGSPQMHACVVCGDDASTKKMKKLGCGHRWCRPCVQRQSKSSGAYAQDMPPRCCTLELVPLAHANEASHTAKYPAGDHNYCPRAQCKTRIRPEDVHHYSNGRSDATCRKCGTRICGSCYGKWHEAKRCPTEAGTTQLKLARQPGWKRCFNCQANVQLEEGCNRMSCRCGAQLCLICGSKGRTCACSPFTYDLDEEEEFDHVQIPVPMVSRERLGGTGGLPRGLRPGPAYTHEPQHYRGPRDDHLARRLQHGDVYNHEEEDEDEDEDEEDDYLNAMGHVPSPFANGDFRRSRNTVVPPAPPSVPLAPASVTHERPQAGGNYVSGVNKARGVRASSMERRLADRFSDQRQASTPRHHPFGQPMPSPTAPPMGMGPLPLPHQIPMVPSPISRRHTMDDDMYEVPFDPRYAPPSFPRRATAHAYMDDFALDTPMGRRRTRHMEPPKEAELAGLTGPNSGVNRVSEWRTYVDPFPLGSQTVV